MSYVNGFIQHIKMDQGLEWKRAILKSLKEKEHVQNLLKGKVPTSQLGTLETLVEQEVSKLAKSSLAQKKPLQVASRDKDTEISKKVLPEVFGLGI